MHDCKHAHNRAILLSFRMGALMESFRGRTVAEAAAAEAAATEATEAAAAAATENAAASRHHLHQENGSGGGQVGRFTGAHQSISKCSLASPILNLYVE